MTIHITALGVLLGFCWVQAASFFVLGLAASLERKPWQSVGYSLAGLALVVLLCAAG